MKINSYDTNLVLIDCLTKIVYYELVKPLINTAGLAEIIINVIVKYHYLLVLIISD